MRADAACTGMRIATALLYSQTGSKLEACKYNMSSSNLRGTCLIYFHDGAVACVVVLISQKLVLLLLELCAEHSSSWAVGALTTPREIRKANKPTLVAKS